MSIGETVRKYRLKKSLTQEELAKKCGYTSRSTINKIENNINEPTIANMRIICKVLGITPNELLEIERR